jgi:hypothetical protein
MTLTLELPQELEKELATEAAQYGLPLPDYALRLLSDRQTVIPAPKTGAELVAYWQNAGLIGNRSDIADSQIHARRLRAEAEKRGVQLN